MTQQEFEKLAGYEVGYEDYVTIIEPMYMATDLTKSEFVEVINKKRFALPSLDSYIKNMKSCAESLKQSCTHYTDYEVLDNLDQLVEMYIDRVFGGMSVNYYYDKQERQTCFYPVAVVIFDTKTSKPLKKIQLL